MRRTTILGGLAALLFCAVLIITWSVQVAFTYDPSMCVGQQTELPGNSPTFRGSQ